MGKAALREQLNISLASQSELARQLREAEAVTGQPKAQIARAVLAAFLDTWLLAEEARRQIITRTKQGRGDSQAATVTVRDIGRAQPPRRDGNYQPEPGYWRAVAARRPMPARVIGRLTNVPIHDTEPPPSRLRRVQPAPVEDIERDSVWD